MVIGILNKAITFAIASAGTALGYHLYNVTSYVYDLYVASK